MDAGESSREGRAAHRRQTWSFVLGAGHSATPASATTPVERLGAVWVLSAEAWTLSGRAWPAYDRANIPGRVVRGPREG